MLLWYIGLALIYAIYHYIFFSYASYIFNYNDNKLQLCAASYLVNLLFWLVYIQFFDVGKEAFAAILFFLLLLAEFILIFKLQFQTALYIALTFSLNLFAKRLAFIGVISLWAGANPTVVLSNKVYFLLVLLLACAFSSNTIAVARKLLSKIYLDTILSDRKNILFLSGVFSVVYLSIILLSTTANIATVDSNLMIYYIISGLMFILAFAIFIIYAYHLAALRLVAKEFKESESINQKTRKALDALKQEASTDSLTKMLSRDQFIENFNKLLNIKGKVFLVFFDIDGLKYVNDKYGHNEGDFYITEAANIIQNYFHNSEVGRYGGDEILVVGAYTSEMEVNSRVVQAYTEIENIAKNNNKSYLTSASYGLVFSPHLHGESADSLINLGDKRMYEMKKHRQKHREVVVPKHIKV